MRKVRATVDREQLKKADVSITITMPLGDWEDLRKITDGKGWPLWEFSQLISGTLTEILNSTERISVASSDDGDGS